MTALADVYQLLLVALLLTASAANAATTISLSGTWDVVIQTPSCNYTEYDTFVFTYANGAYSGTGGTGNSRSDLNGGCSNAGAESGTLSNFYTAAQDLLTESQFLALLNATQDPTALKYEKYMSVTFTSPDSISGTSIGGDGRSQTFTMTRVTTNTLIGTWSVIDGEATIAFDGNGNYTLNQITVPLNAQQLQVWPGIETGAYSWDAATGALVTACPTVDNNGTAGLSDIAPGGYTGYGGTPIGSPCAYSTMTSTLTVNENTATWLLSDYPSSPTLTLTRITGAIPASERQVLLDLYASANGAGWTNNTGWGGAAGTECIWYGVTCDATLSHITEINLNANNLVGTLPAISGLTHIQVFKVRTNQLIGSFPSVSGLTPLKQLSFRQNQFTGSLPSLSGLTSLQTFNASENHLTGSIPSLSDLTALYELDLEINQLSGPVPALPASFPAFSASASVGAWLCNNSLSSSGNPAIDATWNTATGTDWLACQTVTNNTLTVTLSGSGNGAVASSTGGINCGSSCSTSLTGGTSVTLTATPASGSYFAAWSGDCSGAGSCVLTMSAAKNVTAIFKLKPFVAATTSNITATKATIATTIAFNTTDVGKTGAVYVTAWVPSNGLGALGILAASMSHALSVTATNDNPYSGGKIDTRQETLGSVLAATDSGTFVLVQLTSSGWQLVQNGQLTSYVSGVLGDQMSALSILNNADTANLNGAQFCVGYGTSAAEMVTSGRMMQIAAIDSGSTVTASGSCNVAVNPYMGLWWNPNESGWGMSVSQHDSMIFAIPFTYDSTGQPTWYVISSCQIVTAGSCTGELYRVTGGVSPTAAWNGTGIVESLVGTGTLTFDDANNGRFTYSINGVSGSKTIERQLFSSGTAAQAVDYTDLWWNPNESGWGVALTQDVGMIFAAWFAYETDGSPVWYVVSSCPLSGSGCSGDLYRVSGGFALTAGWNGANIAETKVGTASFAFSDSSTGTMSYTIDGATSPRTIIRQSF